jgi:hypothetical protein
VSFVVSLVGVFRDRRKGYAIAGLVFSTWPAWLLLLYLAACE